jgi:hypothetical protein
MRTEFPKSHEYIQTFIKWRGPLCNVPMSSAETIMVVLLEPHEGEKKESR